MQPKIIFHIGAGKTGTSYLQSCFAKNSDILKQTGILYPEAADNKNASEGKITSGNAVSLSLFLNHEIIPNRPRPTQEEITAFFSNPEFHHYKAILLSSEFIAYFDVEKMKWLVEMLKLKGFGIELVYYVRSITDHAISVYSQVVKRHFYKQPFRLYIETEHKVPFLDVIEKLQLIVSNKEFRLLNYDKLRKNIFSHFVHNILECEPCIKLSDFSNQQINRSLDMYELELRRHFNRTFSLERQSTFISDALIYADQQKKATFVVEPEEVEILRARFSDLITKVNQHLPAEQHIAVASDNLIVQKRENIILSEYEKNLVNILSSVIRHALK